MASGFVAAAIFLIAIARRSARPKESPSAAATADNDKYAERLEDELNDLD